MAIQCLEVGDLGDNPKARPPRVREITGADHATHPFKKRRWGYQRAAGSSCEVLPTMRKLWWERDIGKCMAKLRATELRAKSN